MTDSSRRPGRGGGSPEPAEASSGAPGDPGGPATDRTIRTPADLDALDFEKLGGLVPVVAQDAEGGAVLMVAFANREALERSLESGRMHYWSRSRSELWRKGDTSGSVQHLVRLHADCDADTVLALVRQEGAACHTGETTCFGADARPAAASAGAASAGAAPAASAPAASAGATSPDAPSEDVSTGVEPRDASLEDRSPGRVLDDLDRTLAARAADRPEGSYTARLLDDENLRLKKLGEECAELVTALAKGEPDRIPEEAADLIYHMLVAARAAGVGLSEIATILAQRAR